MDKDTLLLVEYYVTQAAAMGYKISSDSELADRALEFAELGEPVRQYFQTLCKTSTVHDLECINRAFDKAVNLKDDHKRIEDFYKYCTSTLKISTYNAGPETPAGGIHQPDKWHYTLRDIYNSAAETKVWWQFQQGANNSLIASSEAGKTTLGRNFSIAIVTGEPTFLGYPLNAPRRQAIIISTEDGKGTTASNFKAMIGSNPPLGIEDRIHFIFDSYNLIPRLGILLEKYPSDIVLIDTWGDAVKGNYQSDITRGKLEEIRNLCRRFGATPILLHHTNKASENIPDKSSIKGAGDFEQACRCVVMLTKYKGSTWMCLVKANDADEQEKDIAYELSFDPKTKVIGLTGKTASRKKICAELRKEVYSKTTGSTVELEMEDMLEPGAKMTHTALCNAIMEKTGLSKSTAERRIRNAIEENEIRRKDDQYYLATDLQQAGLVD